jgi:hypothetical protein
LLPQELEQPQLVAVKSLIFLPPSFIYGLFYAVMHVNVSIGGMK